MLPMKISKGTRLFILGAILVVIDQIIKVLVKTHMDLGETIDVIGDWFKLHFVLNKGMAFGMAFGGVWGKVVLSVFRIILFGALCWWISGLARRKDVPAGVGSIRSFCWGSIAIITKKIMYAIVRGIASMRHRVAKNLMYTPSFVSGKHQPEAILFDYTIILQTHRKVKCVRK